MGDTPQEIPQRRVVVQAPQNVIGDSPDNPQMDTQAEKHEVRMFLMRERMRQPSKISQFQPYPDGVPGAAFRSAPQAARPAARPSAPMLAQGQKGFNSLRLAKFR